MDEDCQEWAPLHVAASRVGLPYNKRSQVSTAAAREGRCNGFLMEQRDATCRDRAHWGERLRGRRVYRVSPFSSLLRSVAEQDVGGATQKLEVVRNAMRRLVEAVGELQALEQLDRGEILAAVEELSRRLHSVEEQRDALRFRLQQVRRSHQCTECREPT